MDMMIQTGRLHEFVCEVIKTRNEEKEEETAWEFWLHKVFEGSWADFRASLNDNSTKAAPTRKELADTVKQSGNILANFHPQKAGGEQNGTVQAVGDNSG